jgi:hypothetical protein
MAEIIDVDAYIRGQPYGQNPDTNEVLWRGVEATAAPASKNPAASAVGGNTRYRRLFDNCMSDYQADSTSRKALLAAGSAAVAAAAHYDTFSHSPHIAGKDRDTFIRDCYAEAYAHFFRGADEGTCSLEDVKELIKMFQMMGILESPSPTQGGGGMRRPDHGTLGASAEGVAGIQAAASAAAQEIQAVMTGPPAANADGAPAPANVGGSPAPTNADGAPAPANAVGAPEPANNVGGGVVNPSKRGRSEATTVDTSKPSGLAMLVKSFCSMVRNIGGITGRGIASGAKATGGVMVAGFATVGKAIGADTFFSALKTVSDKTLTALDKQLKGPANAALAAAIHVSENKSLSHFVTGLGLLTAGHGVLTGQNIPVYLITSLFSYINSLTPSSGEMIVNAVKASARWATIVGPGIVLTEKIAVAYLGVLVLNKMRTSLLTIDLTREPASINALFEAIVSSLPKGFDGLKGVLEEFFFSKITDSAKEKLVELGRAIKAVAPPAAADAAAMEAEGGGGASTAAGGGGGGASTAAGGGGGGASTAAGGGGGGGGGPPVHPGAPRRRLPSAQAGGRRSKRKHAAKKHKQKKTMKKPKRHAKA